jgi:hypothetical protein
MLFVGVGAGTRARHFAARLVGHAVPTFDSIGKAAVGELVVIDVWAAAIPMLPASIAANQSNSGHPYETARNSLIV